MVYDLERPFLELVALKELWRFFSTPQETDLHDLTLIGWTQKRGRTKDMGRTWGERDRVRLRSHGLELKFKNYRLVYRG